MGRNCSLSFLSIAKPIRKDYSQNQLSSSASCRNFERPVATKQYSSLIPIHFVFAATTDFGIGSKDRRSDKKGAFV
ncbi:putative lipoprotein [Leptospira inadai serovar Lyme str. 10]|uniref:Putative lipoprotein n=1 Tax=Leptospira inadai serovar Lyme str. 10 TaxID=1049790 RepID=V6HVD7_9LEPT|nr:putative lipoprotein [Leptospira inadai serovar Lyme str. 10]